MTFKSRTGTKVWYLNRGRNVEGPREPCTLRWPSDESVFTGLLATPDVPSVRGSRFPRVSKSRTKFLVRLVRDSSTAVRDLST
jgi:hypothetical protein